MLKVLLFETLFPKSVMLIEKVNICVWNLKKRKIFSNFSSELEPFYDLNPPINIGFKSSRSLNRNRQGPSTVDQGAENIK